MLAHLPTIAGLLVPNTPLRQPMTAMRAAQPLAMAAPAYGKMLNLLNQWDDEEDGDSTSCMAGMELDFLAERVGECGEEQCEALLPELMDLFDSVLADCDEACVTIGKMQTKLAELSA